MLTDKKKQNVLKNCKISLERGEVLDYAPMFAWILEREDIRFKKESGLKKPWTSDPILQENFFCNAFREKDKVTQHYMKWIEPVLGNKKYTLFNTCVYRLINHPETLDHIGVIRNWNLKQFTSILQTRYDKGEKIYGSAYMFTSSNWTEPKHLLTAARLDEIWPMVLSSHCTFKYLEEVFETIRKWPLIGPFIAYEIVTDLTYNIMKDCQDKNTFVNLGPGAKRGLNRLLGNVVTAQITNSLETSWMEGIYLDVELRHLDWFIEPELWSLRAVEHSLCEFDKYERVRLNQGRMKRKYNGKV